MNLSDFDNGLAAQRRAQIRAEVARERLRTRARRDVRPEADAGGASIRGGVARGAMFVRALFGTHPTA